MKVTLKQLCKVYQTRHPDWDDLVEVASRLAAIAKTVPGFSDDKDRDAGKDAYSFCEAYHKAISHKTGGEKVWSVSGFIAPEQYLLLEIDILLSGMHSSVTWIEYYIQNGSKSVLDAIFEWNGDGSLSHYIQEYTTNA